MRELVEIMAVYIVWLKQYCCGIDLRKVLMEIVGCWRVAKKANDP
jgi:hypothetical protein